MTIDDSFKKPGAIPFKWEIRPGIPKLRQSQHPFSDDELASSPQEKQQRNEPSLPRNRHNPPPEKSWKLKAPPAGLYYRPPPESRSFGSSPRTQSERHRVETRPVLARPECVSPGGCFPSPLVKRKNGTKRSSKTKTTPEPVYNSDLGTPSRWSVSSRRTLSPFRGSPFSSSFSSYQSSPRPVSDAEWAGFGLF